MTYTLDRTVNVGEGFTAGGGGTDAKAYFNYIMISNNRSDGFIDDVLLTGIPMTTWNPTPVNNATGVSDTSVVFQWNKGHDPNDDPNSSVTGYSLNYVAYPAATVPAEPNFLSPAAVTVTGISAVGNTGLYPSSGSLIFGNDKVVFWRVNQNLAVGGPTIGNTWRFATIISVPIITAQPVNTLIMKDGSGELAISATSTSPDLVYTWKKSTDAVIDVGDATVGTDANTLPIPSATVSDEKYYYCKLTNNGGANTTYSNVVTLGVGRPVALWTLDQAKYVGNQYVDDSGDGHNADPNGIPAFVAGANGAANGAVTINTVNGYASAGTWNPSQFTGQFTVSLWAKWAGQTAPTTWQGLISKETSYGTGTMMWQLEVTSAAQASSTVVLKNGTGSGDVSTPALSVGTWEHVAVTFNGTTATVYRNGVSATSGTWTMGTGTDAPVNIGISARSLTQNLMFNGALDDVQIYNYALSNTEIADLHYAVIHTPVCILDYASGFDYDKDCVVDLADFAAMAAQWLDCGLHPISDCP